MLQVLHYTRTWIVVFKIHGLLRDYLWLYELQLPLRLYLKNFVKVDAGTTLQSSTIFITNIEWISYVIYWTDTTWVNFDITSELVVFQLSARTRRIKFQAILLLLYFVVFMKLNLDCINGYFLFTYLLGVKWTVLLWSNKTRVLSHFMLMFIKPPNPPPPPSLCPLHCSRHFVYIVPTLV